MKLLTLTLVSGTLGIVFIQLFGFGVAFFMALVFCGILGWNWSKIYDFLTK